MYLLTVLNLAPKPILHENCQKKKNKLDWINLKSNKNYALIIIKSPCKETAAERFGSKHLRGVTLTTWLNKKILQLLKSVFRIHWIHFILWKKKDMQIKMDRSERKPNMEPADLPSGLSPSIFVNQNLKMFSFA